MPFTIGGGKVKVVVLDTGSNVIGKVRNDPTFSQGTGVCPIDLATNPSGVFRLLRTELHLTAAPTTGTFTVTVDSGDDSKHDTLLYSRDMAVGTPVDLVAPFGEGFEFKTNDDIGLAWPNADGNTYGVRVVYELL